MENGGKTILILAMGLALIAGCSSSQDDEGTKTLKEKAAAIGQEGAEAIKSPLDQAKKARELTEQHNKAMQESSSKL